MGIRKHLEEHPGEAKLSDLSLEIEQPKELVFDPEKEISDQERRTLINDAKISRLRHNWYDFSKRAFDLALLFPEKITELGRFDSATLKSMQKSLSYYRQDSTGRGNWFVFIRMAASMRLLFPKQIHKLNLDHSLFLELKEYFENDRRQQAKEDQDIGYFRFLKIAFPEYFSEIKFKRYDWEALEQNIKKFHSPENDNIRAFIDYAEVAKMVFPEKKLPVKLDSATWSRMKDFLETLRQKEEWELFARYARKLLFLGADKVEITNQGLKLTMPKQDLKQQKAKRPERRQF